MQRKISFALITTLCSRPGVDSLAGAGALPSDCGDLTQNTAWTNVERALRSLPARFVDDRWNSPSAAPTVASFESLRRIFPPEGTTAEDVCKAPRPAVRRVIKSQFAQSTEKLREELLALNGIGPETADSILLYAGKHPVFVVEAYTRRILDRYGILAHKSKYEEIRQLFERALPTVARAPSPPVSHEKQIVAAPRNLAGASHLPSPMSTAKRSSLVQVYDEMHGLIVGVGKNYCVKSKALCELCPLQSFLVTGRKPVSRNESPRSLGTEQQLSTNARTPAPALQRRIRL
jgi:endonuclease III related protein